MLSSDGHPQRGGFMPPITRSRISSIASRGHLSQLPSLFQRRPCRHRRLQPSDAVAIVSYFG